MTSHKPNFWRSKPFWILVGIGLLIWVYHRYSTNYNQWTHSPKAGIRLPMRYELHGIDVSKFQGEIDWRKVKSMPLPSQHHLRFVFVKATEGTSIVDKRFRENFRAAAQYGFLRGAYHFYIPWRDPVVQANFFVKNVTLQAGDLPPVLDIEKNAQRPNKDIVRDINVWLNLIKNHYGKKPIIYTNEHFYIKFIKGNFEDYPLWIADYSSELLDLYPTKSLYFWQHSKAGWVEGIRGQVDYNVAVQPASSLADICIE